MESVNLVIDVGSSGIRALAFTAEGQRIASVKEEYETFYPHAGWAEQDPRDWERCAVNALAGLAKALAGRYAFGGMSFTGQCPTYVPVDKDLRPLGCALIYQDNRAEEESEALVRDFGNKYIHSRDGHSVQPFYILPKVLWHKNHMPELYKRLWKVLQPCDYLEAYLTGKLSTDYAYACGTLAYDRTTGGWNRPLLKALGLREDLFPDNILHSWDVSGTLRDEIADKTGLPRGLKTVRGGPDSQCCSLGVAATKPDILSNMSGTSTCLNGTVDEPVSDLRVGNYLHVIPGRWSTEVGLNTTGVSLNWVSGLLFPEQSEKERFTKIQEYVNRSPAGSNGLLYLPYLSNGERDNPWTKGTFYNLNLFSSREDIVRAAMEGVAFAEKERADLLASSGAGFSSMRISGGGASSGQWCQIKADVMNLPVYALRDVDAAELGAAMLASVGTGESADFSEAIERCSLHYDEYLPDAARVSLYREQYGRFLELEQKLSRQRPDAAENGICRTVE